MARFPAEKLIPAGATITAVLNGSRSSPTGFALFFRIDINFRPIEYSDSEFECSMGWDLMPIAGIRDWRQLEGVTVEGTNPGKNGKGALEGAFLLNSWSGATYSSIKLGKRQGCRFPIEATMDVDFLGWTEGDDKPFRVTAKTTAVFNGFSPSGFAKNRASAKALAAAHVDLPAFELVERGKSFFFAPRLTEQEKKQEAALAAAQLEANRPPPPPVAPEEIELAKGIRLVHVEAPKKRVLPKLKARIAGFVEGNDRLLATSSAGCILALLRSKKKLVVAHGKARNTVKLPDFPYVVIGSWSKDAALVQSNDTIYRVSLPSGRAQKVWQAPAGDGQFPLAADTSFWIPSVPTQPFGPGRLVVYTTARLLVLEEKSGKLQTVAEYPTRKCMGVILSGDGCFLLIDEGKNRFVLLGMKSAKLKVLARFKNKGTFVEREGHIFTERFERDRFYALRGQGELLAKVK